MKTIWKMDVLQDLISFYGKGIVPQYVDQKNCDAIWVLNQKCNTNHKISYDKARYTDIKHKPVSQERYLRIGDIIINATGYGTAGRVAQVDNLIGDTTVDSHMIIIRANYNKVHPKYLAYYMKHNQATIESYAEGSTGQTEISKNRLCYEFKVGYPDLETQKKIAKVLSALDDKIELNNQINKNLEEQAQALYKSWFVDFEPFGGVMPADWAQADIYSLAEVIYGAPFASKYFNNMGDGIPIIRIRDLKEQKFITYTTEKHSKGYLLQKGDIVVGMDGEFRPYIWGNSQAWLNQRVCVFKNKRPNGKAFLYYTIKPLLLAIEQTQVATTVIHIGKKDFDLFKVTLPANEILDKFDNITTPIIDQIVQNTFENKILCDIRETLLPKLMSGEIDVDNVEI